MRSNTSPPRHRPVHRTERDYASAPTAEVQNACSNGPKNEGRRPTVRAWQWVLSLYGVCLATVVLVLLYPEILHWSLLPITASGILVGVDATHLLRGREHLFRPSVVVSLFGLHLFYLAPILHLAWDYWPRLIIAPADWQEMLGWLAVIHVFGLSIYRLAISGPHERNEFRRIRTRRLTNSLALTATISLLSFIGLVVSQGGVSAYLRLVTENRDGLEGFGWILLISEAWPLLGFMYVLLKFPRVRNSALRLLVLFVVILIAQFLTGGLRGSRSNLIWPALIALVFLHLFARRIPRRAVVVGALAMMPFMYLYGIYKGGGVDAVQAMRAGVPADVLASETGRGLDLVLLEDFGRAGTQVVALDGVLQDRGAGVVWGLGYVGDIAKLVPDSLVPIEVPDKVDLGTAALYGVETLDGEWRSSRIYGLTGEALLNFGPLGAVFVYWLLAFLVKRLDSLYDQTLDAPVVVLGHFILPLATVSCILFVGSDLDNVLWFLAKQGGLLLLVLSFSVGPRESVSTQ